MLPDPAKSRVVLVGASRFADPELPDLPAVANNLRGLAECLRDVGRCTIVADPQSPVALVDPIHDAAQEAEDTLVVYYAGHGLVHPRTLGLLLAVVESTSTRTHTTVPYDLVRENVLDSPAARKVVILDCCFSGRALGGQADPTTTVANEAIIEGTYLLAATPANKQALSPPGETYTAFTGALLRLLTEGVPDGPQHLRLDLIYRHVRDALRRNARPEPQLRVDNTASELALIRNASYSQSTPEVRPSIETAPPSTGPVLLAKRYLLGTRLTEKVHLATDTQTQETVVVKRLPANYTLGVHHRAILLMRALLGSHVVLPYFSGRTLAEVLQADGPMPEDRAVEIVIEICDALGLAHAQGVRHGDLTSDHVMLMRNDAVVILNLGRRDGQDTRSDVYAAGLLLVELVTGRRPAADRPIPPGFPAGLATVVSKALYPNINGGYRTAGELWQALRQR
ncbi:caspase, EACC1-associated type [Actinocrispum wychmicini]|uniref:Caspase domain-containing protein n=1 Tax=Actinocrispum wychmicini TaxID=1213861 RepID=A0A4R2J2Y4_9PSEU|nr:caspase family protein [Actinocrispum wychmicini]TCO50679.1 caspase domain-containing protein [Actinocrispum wychmicini]